MIDKYRRIAILAPPKTARGRARQPGFK